MLSNILVAMIGQFKAKIKLREFLKLREVLILFLKLISSHHIKSIIRNQFFTQSLTFNNALY